MRISYNSFYYHLLMVDLADLGTCYSYKDYKQYFNNIPKNTPI